MYAVKVINDDNLTRLFEHETLAMAVTAHGAWVAAGCVQVALLDTDGRVMLSYEKGPCAPCSLADTN